MPWLLRFRLPLISLAVLWLGLVSRPSAADGRPVRAESIHWMGNYPQGRRMALRLHRLMIVSLETDWCTWCVVMDADVFGDPQVSRQLNPGYIFVRQNAEAFPEGVALQRRFQVSSYPATVVVEPVEELFVTICGYRDSQALLRDVQAAADDLNRLAALRERTRSLQASLQDQEDLAQAYAQRGFYWHAAELYDGLVRDPALPNPAEYYFKLALCRANAGESGEALSALGQLQQRFPGSTVAPVAEALQGEIWLHDGERSKAKRILSTWLLKYPSNPLADHVRSLLAHIDQSN